MKRDLGKLGVLENEGKQVETWNLELLLFEKSESWVKRNGEKGGRNDFEKKAQRGAKRLREDCGKWAEVKEGDCERRRMCVRWSDRGRDLHEYYGGKINLARTAHSCRLLSYRSLAYPLLAYRLLAGSQLTFHIL